MLLPIKFNCDWNRRRKIWLASHDRARFALKLVLKFLCEVPRFPGDDDIWQDKLLGTKKRAKTEGSLVEFKSRT